MIIGIDASSLTLPHPTGVQRYAEYIIRHLIDIGAGEHQFRLYAPKPLPEPFTLHQVVIKSPRFWTQIRLPIELFLHKPDVFFQPSYMLPPILPCPAVAAVHDMAWLKFPNAYSEIELKRQKAAISRLVKQRAVVITPSQSTKNDLVEYVGIEKLKIFITPFAPFDDPNPSKILPDNIEQYANQPLILAVGRLEDRKNTTTLVNAFGELCHAIKNKNDQVMPVLVLIGQGGHGAEKVFEAIAKARKSGSEIIHISGANDQEKADWMSVASVLCYPSLYEGFGFPILEAFRAGIPVVTTRNSSIPEVAGDAVQYVEQPNNVDELAAALNSVLYNPNKSTRLIAAGNKQLEQFSWVNTTESTLSALQYAVKHR